MLFDFYQDNLSNFFKMLFYGLHIVMAYLFLIFTVVVLEEWSVFKHLVRNRQGAGSDYGKVIGLRYVLVVVMTIPAFFRLNEYVIILVCSSLITSIIGTCIPVTV